MKTIPEFVHSTQDRINQAMTNYDLVEDYCFPLSNEDFDARYVRRLCVGVDCSGWVVGVGRWCQVGCGGGGDGRWYQVGCVVCRWCQVGCVVSISYQAGCVVSILYQVGCVVGRWYQVSCVVGRWYQVSCVVGRWYQVGFEDG